MNEEKFKVFIKKSRCSYRDYTKRVTKVYLYGEVNEGSSKAGVLVLP